MSWWPVIALSGAAYGLKLLGLLIGDRLSADTARRWSLEIVVVPLLAALIVVQTITSGRHFALDARAPALFVAALLVWRRAPSWSSPSAPPAPLRRCG